VKQEPHVAIILVNWNGRVDTLTCLQSLLYLRDTDFRVLVCDNGSSDGSLAAFAQWGKRSLSGTRSGVRIVSAAGLGAAQLDEFLTIVNIGANLGFAAANNIGIKIALSVNTIDAVWLLNNDTEVEQDTLSALRNRVAEDLDIGICGSTLVFFNDRTRVQSLGTRYNLSLGFGKMLGFGLPPDHLPLRKDIERSITYVQGASMFVTRRYIEAIGPMQEDYFLYFEELDWSIRGAKRFKLGWAPNSVVFHKEGSSIGTSTRGRASNLSIYYYNVNSLRVTARFARFSLPLVFFRIMARVARFLLQRDVSGALITLRATADFIVGHRRTGGDWLANSVEPSGKKSVSLRFKRIFSPVPREPERRHLELEDKHMSVRTYVVNGVLSVAESMFRGAEERALTRGNHLTLIPTIVDRRGGTTTYIEWGWTIGLFQALIFQNLPDQRPFRVLDVGSGAGRLAIAYSLYLSDADTYTGLEVREKDVAFCRKRYNKKNFSFIHFNANNRMYASKQANKQVLWPVESQEFNLISALSVWTHMNENDARFYLSEVARALAPKGRAIISFFILDEFYDESVGRRGNRTSRFYPQHEDKWIFDQPIDGSADWLAPSWADVPEEATGIRKVAFDDMVKASGLSVRHYYPGSWKEHVGLFFQDIVIFEKL
jgi:GT2 family glycosyltransferase/SAM-dependent methyltransferase